MTRRVAAALAVALLPFLASPARADPPPEAEYASRAAKAAREDAVELRRIAQWGDANGVPREADADWERVLEWLSEAGASPDEQDVARRRLHYVRREGAWIRDAASWAVLRATPDGHPERRGAYAEKRRGFARPSARRQNDLATWCRGRGLAARADEHLHRALERDPDDVWARLSLGDAWDPDAGWIPAALRARKITAARAAEKARRLKALATEPVKEAEESRWSEAAGKRLSVWRLHEWRLETDFDDEGAAATIAAAELAARWFREQFSIPPGEPVLEAGGTFVVVTTNDLYKRVLYAHEGLSEKERAFASTLGAYPFPRARPDARAEVLVERPDVELSSDACLHFAIHWMAQARLGVEAQEAWLYEGLPAYAAPLLSGVHGTFCVRMESTGGATAGLQPDHIENWPAIVVSLASSGDDFPLKGLVGSSLNGLDGKMLVKSWSVLRWLFEDRPDDARAFFAERASGASSADALRRATGRSLDDLDALWRAHVTATGGD